MPEPGSRASIRQEAKTVRRIFVQLICPYTGAVRVAGVSLIVATLAIAGCGNNEDASSAGRPTSRSATITAQVSTAPETRDSDAEQTGRMRRQVFITVRPHCDDRSTTLDCEATYSLMTHYVYRPGKPAAMRCEKKPTGIGFAKAGGFRLVPALPPSASPPVVCNDAEPGRISVEASLPMADTSRARGKIPRVPPPTFTVTLAMTAKQGGGPHYLWTSRDGARCAGRLSARPTPQRIACAWR